jgi:hypothetical protein
MNKLDPKERMNDEIEILASIVLTLHKLFQNPINILIKKETNQIIELFVFETKKQKTKQRE